MLSYAINHQPHPTPLPRNLSSLDPADEMREGLTVLPQDAARLLRLLKIDPFSIG